MEDRDAWRAAVRGVAESGAAERLNGSSVRSANRRGAGRSSGVRGGVGDGRGGAPGCRSSSSAYRRVSRDSASVGSVAAFVDVPASAGAAARSVDVSVVLPEVSVLLGQRAEWQHLQMCQQWRW